MVLPPSKRQKAHKIRTGSMPVRIFILSAEDKPLPYRITLFIINNNITFLCVV